MKKVPFYTFTILLFWTCNIPTIGTVTKPKDRKIPHHASAVNSKQQSALPKDEVRQVYTQAIGEYIKSLRPEDKSSLDTLFIGRHPDFPDIELPAIIQNTNILALTPDEADDKAKYRESFVYVNVMGWVTRGNSEFILVTFLVSKPRQIPSYAPQHNCLIHFEYNPANNEYELYELKFEYPYPR